MELEEKKKGGVKCLHVKNARIIFLRKMMNLWAPVFSG
jgi:hypothetical protein